MLRLRRRAAMAGCFVCVPTPLRRRRRINVHTRTAHSLYSSKQRRWRCTTSFGAWMGYVFPLHLHHHGERSFVLSCTRVSSVFICRALYTVRWRRDAARVHGEQTRVPRNGAHECGR